MVKGLKEKQAELKKLETRLSDPAVLSDPQKIKELSEKYAELKDVVDAGKAYEQTQKQLEGAKQALRSADDNELKQLAETEIEELEAKLPSQLEKWQSAMTTSDPLDQKNIIVEIRAGTGGDEAALFAVNLFRMYTRFAERQGWKTSLVSASQNNIGGFKEVIFSIEGKNVYSKLKFESGVHRVQRVPETEKQGRVHTSTATVAILPEAEEVDLKLDPKDLKIETSTSQGHGGQSVNTTYSAIRVTHIPTGIVVSCQDERSQQQNREKALRVLRARLFVAEQERLQKERSQARKSQVGTGERSEKIRTYNYSQDRVTDHRIKRNFHDIASIMDGEIAKIIAELRIANQQSA